MSSLKDTIWIELRKALCSRMPVYTALGFLMMPLGCAFMIFIYKNPDLARRLGLVSAKANLVVGAANWPTYLSILSQAAAIGGIFLFSMIVSWVFGREFSDGTLKDLLAVPVARSSILLGKFSVVAVWSAALTIEIYIISLITGVLIQLPQGSPEVLLQGSATLLISAGLVIMTVLPFAFFASLGRGYLLPIGMTILTTLLANLVVVAGWGEYFPWSVPALHAMGTTLSPISYWIVILTGLSGILGTCLWWNYADQSR